MRALVTGGAGFIGSHLVDRLLADGWDVRIVDSLEPQVHAGIPDYLSPEAELIRGDIGNRELVANALRDVDVLVHLAAAVGVGQSMYEIERYVAANTLATAILLEEATRIRDRLQKLVVASSMSIYGEGAYRCDRDERTVAPAPRPVSQLAARDWELHCPSCGEPVTPVPTSEAKRLEPTSIYAITKRDHEEMVLTTGRAYGIPATALRFFNVYGPRQALSNPYTGVAAIFASRLLGGKPPIIFEDGRQSRDFVHVSDIVAAIEAAMAPGVAVGCALNVGTGTPTMVMEVAETLAEHLDVPIEPILRNEFRAGDIRHCYADVALAAELLGYEPQISFREGMSELAAWLAGQEAVDRVDEATAALVQRGLTT